MKGKINQGEQQPNPVEDIVNNLTRCLICLDVCEQAVECESCTHLMCEGCYKSLARVECPNCRKFNFAALPSKFARKLIGSLPTDCPNGCGQHLTRGDLEEHEATCPEKKFNCAMAEGCDFKGKHEEILVHLGEAHEKELIQLYSKNDDVTAKKPEEKKAPKRREFWQLPGGKVSVIDRLQNERGRWARLGETGKFYCGGKLEGPFCQCCDGNCGPGNGCNCQGCMKLDLQAKRLPKGYLMNREGFPCAIGENGVPFCRRKVGDTAYCDTLSVCMACNILKT
jgi:hypothetical protein